MAYEDEEYPSETRYASNYEAPEPAAEGTRSYSGYGNPNDWSQAQENQWNKQYSDWNNMVNENYNRWVQPDLNRGQQMKNWQQSMWQKQFEQGLAGKGPGGATAGVAGPSVSAGRGGSSSGGGSYGSGRGSVFLGPTMAKPTYQAIPYPTLPEYKAPEYALPAEDRGYYQKVRAEQAAPGMRALRERAAMENVATRNMENPAARSQALQGAMQGYGTGLSQVQAGASSAARAEAGRKRAEDISAYNTKYHAMTNEQMVNFNNKAQRMVQDWVQSLQKQQMQYGEQMALYRQQPLDVQLREEQKAARASARSSNKGR